MLKTLHTQLSTILPRKSAFMVNSFRQITVAVSLAILADRMSFIIAMHISKCK